MRKFVKILGVIFITMLLASCSAVTKNDLKKNDWIIEATKKDEVNMIVSFSDHIMSMNVDAESIKSEATNEWEELGEEIAKSLVNNVSFKLEYELKGNKIKIQSTDDDKETVEYTISKDKKSIVFTPEKGQKDAEEFIIKPYKKDKKKSIKKEVTSSTEEIPESTTTTSSESASYEEVEESQATVESSSQVQYVDYSNFVGVWGVPSSDNVFSINPDHTFSHAEIGSESGVSNTGFSDVSTFMDGNYMTMIFYQNGVKQQVWRVGDQLQTQSGNYTYISNQTLSDWLYQKNIMDQSSTTIVQEDEGPTEIAQRVGITVEQLLELNGMTQDNYFFSPGQQVKIK